MPGNASGGESSARPTHYAPGVSSRLPNPRRRRDRPNQPPAHWTTDQVVGVCMDTLVESNWIEVFGPTTSTT